MYEYAKSKESIVSILKSPTKIVEKQLSQRLNLSLPMKTA